MKAVIYNKKHSPYPLDLKEVDKPIPKDDEVLIKVVAVSLNAADYRSIKMRAVPKKKIFGSAVSGIVESVGKNIKNFKPADEVIADLADFGFGGLAEYAVAPERAIVHKPPHTSFEDAATLPVAATTALQAIRDKGNIKKGQQVLVVGSSGGVGAYALQLAKHFGAKVTAISSTKNLEQATSLGADKIIDYTETDFTKDSTRYDLILAINGNYPLLGYRRILKPQGTCVIIGGALTQIFKSIFFGRFLSFGEKTMKTLAAKADPEDLKYVAQLLDEGNIKAIIHKKYPLDQAAEAMDYLGKGHSSGKVIVYL